MILIDSYPYDLMVSGEVQFESEVTSFVVERSADISDHIHNKPITLNMEVIVSDSPLEPIASDDSRRVDAVTEAVFGSDQVPLPSAEAYERLLAIRDEKRLVTIEIPVASRASRPGKRTFQNMALTHLSDRHDKDTAGGMFFTVSFQQVRFVDNQRVFVRTATPGGKGKRGGKATTGKVFTGDDRVLWRMGNPPGGPLEPDYGWAVVVVKWDDGKGGPKAHAKYFYSGESNMLLVASQKPLAGVELSTAALRTFILDIERENNQAAERRRQAQDRETIDAISNNQDSEAAKARNLPPGIRDLSRFTEDPSAPKPVVYGSPESQAQILRPNPTGP